MIPIALALATSSCDPSLPDTADESTLAATVLQCLAVDRVDDAARLADRIDALPTRQVPAVLALARVRLRQAASPCTSGYDLGAVVTLLLDRRSDDLVEQLRSDPTFADLRRIGRFRRLTDDGTGWLEGTTWSQPNPAHALPIGRLQLESGGVGRWSRRLDPFDATMEDTPVTWTVTGDTVVVQRDGETVSLAIGAGGESLGPFQDVPDGCG